MSFRQQESVFLRSNMKMKKTKLKMRQMLLCFSAEHLWVVVFFHQTDWKQQN